MELPRCRAFTLLEVLVALAIFAMVAAVVLTSVGRSIRHAEQLQLKTLASWIADNRITELQLANPAPGEGNHTFRLEYAGRQWEVLSKIEPTSDRGLRRVNVWVALVPERGIHDTITNRALVSLTGFLSGSQ